MTTQSLSARFVRVYAVGSLLLFSSVSALAQDLPPPDAPKPPPYSLPWLLRPAVPGTVVRLDETLAFFEDPASGASGETYVTSLIATYKAGPNVALVFRQMLVSNSAPSGGPDPSGSGFTNALLGANFSTPFGSGWRWTGFLASTIPFGSGGGDLPDAGAAAAISAGISARSAMDNSMFAVNYWTGIVGLGLARITPGLTLQAEVTLLQGFRVRGPETQDSSRTNFTAGLHVGLFFSPDVSFGAELRMQRWLSDVAPVRGDPSARDQFTVGFGPRLHFKVGESSWIRPGISYSRALDDPMANKDYNILQIDLPYAF
jgi:hypothetical protein